MFVTTNLKQRKRNTSSSSSSALTIKNGFFSSPSSSSSPLRAIEQRCPRRQAEIFIIYISIHMFACLHTYQVNELAAFSWREHIPNEIYHWRWSRLFTSNLFFWSNEKDFFLFSLLLCSSSSKLLDLWLRWEWPESSLILTPRIKKWSCANVEQDSVHRHDRDAIQVIDITRSIDAILLTWTVIGRSIDRGSFSFSDLIWCIVRLDFHKPTDQRRKERKENFSGHQRKEFVRIHDEKRKMIQSVRFELKMMKRNARNAGLSFSWSIIYTKYAFCRFSVVYH